MKVIFPKEQKKHQKELKVGDLVIAENGAMHTGEVCAKKEWAIFRWSRVGNYEYYWHLIASTDTKTDEFTTKFYDAEHGIKLMKEYYERVRPIEAELNIKKIGEPL